MHWREVLQENPKQFLNMPEEDMAALLPQIRDSNLKLSLAFGIGLHHAGLVEGDRKIVEALFCEQKIMVLVATATLAWGVNFPAHLVVVKGTEYFDGGLLTAATPLLMQHGRQDAPIRGLPHHRCAANDGPGRAAAVRQRGHRRRSRAGLEEALLPEVHVGCGVLTGFG